MRRLARPALVAVLGFAAFAAGGCAPVVPPPPSAPLPVAGSAAALTGAATVEFLDVGQGDAILIRSPEGKTALIDAGPSHQVVSLLRQRGVDALDLAVVSHHHADHYGGMLEVVRELRPRVFLSTDSPHSSAHYLRLLELVREQGVRAVFPTASPRTIELGTVLLKVFPQAPNDPHEENNNSLGLRVEFGVFSVLLPGDAEVHERRWWETNAADLCADATVLKLAHHGSRNGTDAPWLALVRPQLAVASLGKDNEFGHPHHQTLELLTERGIPLLRTDRDGTVTIRSDGKSWQVVSHPDVATGSPTRPRADRHARPGPAGGQIDINTATEAELRTIPGIGPVLARRIIAGRPYQTVDDLGQVEGIGKKRLADLRPFVTLP